MKVGGSLLGRKLGSTGVGGFERVTGKRKMSKVQAL